MINLPVLMKNWQATWGTDSSYNGVTSPPRGHQGDQQKTWQVFIKTRLPRKENHPLYHILWWTPSGQQYQQYSRQKIDAATSELEATIEMKLDKITYDPTKTNDSFDMNISDIPSNKPSSYYEQPSAYLIKLPLLKSPGKYSRAS